jgi:tryptophanyl-tRNA synthetase
MSTATKTLLSGVKPTGRPHVGNYFGAMRQVVELQDEYASFVFLADYHALNFIQNADQMRAQSMGVAMDYLAIGLDPAKVVLFKQSDVSAHTELAWIFDTITTVPYLMRSHAYKDAEAKGHEVSVGTFNYPMLMAADILLYNPDVVPVGADQKQHVEYARDTADKFNRIFGDTFKLPEAIIREDVATVRGTDGRKMSKSYGNTIELFASRDEIANSVMSIVTDSSGDRPKNVYAIHRLLKSEEELEPLYGANTGNYKALKEVLIEDLEFLIAPLRVRREEIATDKASVMNILRAGAEKANERAEKKLKEVKEMIGVK